MTPTDRVLDPSRLAAVAATGLLDTDQEAAFDDLAALAARVLQAPFGFVTLVDDHRSFWKARFGIAADGPRQNTVEESFCQYVVRSGEPLIVGDVTANALTAQNPSIAGMGVRAWAGYPLMSPDGQPLGSFCVVDTKVREWTSHDVDTLRVLSQAAGREIALRAVADQATHHARQMISAGRHDRIVSRALQDAMLTRLPEPVSWDIAARYVTADFNDQVGGDWYDALLLPNGATTLVIGDIAGHNITAAIIMGQVRSLLRALTWEHDDEPPSTLITRLDRAMAGLGITTMASVLVAIVQPADAHGSRHLQWSSAGHPMPVIMHTGGHAALLSERADPPLGVAPGARERHDHTAAISPGHTLLLYTDGLVEQRSADPDERDALLLGTLREVGGAALDIVLDKIIEVMVGGEPVDDVAVLAARFHADEETTIF